MLVLSRRPDQKIVFPSIGVTINVLKVRGGVAKIGIDAPRELEILREEVATNQGGATSSADRPSMLVNKSQHDLRNRLNTARLAVYLAQLQIHQGDNAEAAKTLETVVEGFKEAEKIMAAQRSPQKLRALLVDDDRNERELLASCLKSFGYDVETAGDGVEALEYLQEHQLPDVVLLDMAMPVCDGPLAVRHIRETPWMRNLKVFGVSGADPGEAGVAIGPEGVDGWFKKPLDPARMIGQIRQETFGSITTV
ncbi:response regulator [Gimesia chilikensis]|uniref:response regulator n=1 Tax=Gimesia chilikensis TaxID=2605989 RepID=UPI0011ED9E64|nr:response regulator [Gimesia chilikensis]KAA0138990.1 response regulator [Gimesia chilikensis]